MHTIYGKRLLMLKPSQIRIFTDKSHRFSDSEELSALAESISANGIIEPLAVRKNGDGFYILISGERRLKAAVMAGLRRVPCVLHKADSKVSALYYLTENLQRSPIGYLNEAECLTELIKLHKMSPETISRNTGLNILYINDKLKLMLLSREIRERLEYAKLSEDYAKALLLLPEYQRAEMLSEIIAEGLNIDETHQLINQRLNPDIIPKPIIKAPLEPELKPVRKSSIGDIRLFSNSITKLVDTLKNSGIKASFKKTETGKYIEYKVRIKKDTAENGEFAQLRLSSV